MKIQVQRPGFFKVLISSLIGLGLACWAMYHGFVADPEMGWLGSLGGLFVIAVAFLPAGSAYDMSSDIPEIKELKKNERYKKVRVRHPSFGWVLTWNILLFVTGGISWFVALFLSTGTVDVDIPDDIAEAAGLKKSAPNPIPSDSEELIRWKNLLDNGAISQEEFEQKKNELMGAT